MKDKNNQMILVVPASKTAGIYDLLDIVANDGNMGKKTDKYWIISVQAKFQPNGNANVEFYNQFLHYSEIRGYSYLQILF